MDHVRTPCLPCPRSLARTGAEHTKGLELWRRNRFCHRQRQHCATRVLDVDGRRPATRRRIPSSHHVQTQTQSHQPATARHTLVRTGSTKGSNVGHGKWWPRQLYPVCFVQQVDPLLADSVPIHKYRLGGATPPCMTV